MDTEAFIKFIRPELLVLIPVLYLIGVALKSNTNFDNKYIPIALGITSIALCIIETVSMSVMIDFHEVLGAVFTGITQGVMCAGASVYINQIVKQHKPPTSDAPAVAE